MTSNHHATHNDATVCWQTSRHRIILAEPRVMGIVNVTPDSFSDGGRHASTSQAISHAEQLLNEGAHILDFGAESTRPGAAPVSVEEELSRLVPVLQQAIKLGVPISVDTAKSAVMRVALDLGVDIINDIAALRGAGSLDVVATHPSCGICLMHMKGEPGTMQLNPVYDDVVADVKRFLGLRAQALRARHVAAERIVLDPGIGFGKTLQHNFTLLQRQADLLSNGYPLLVGWSRKSSLGHVTGRGVDERLSASIAAALAAVQRGAKIVRVHDVAATVDALKVWRAAGLP